MASTYSKPFLDIDEQVQLLAERGLAFPDRETLAGVLERVGYYRLSGYWYEFRQFPKVEGEPRPSDFRDGACLDEILEIYEFDERLRSLLALALSRIEVAVRSRVGHVLGKRHRFAHFEAVHLNESWTCGRGESYPDPLCGEVRWEKESEHFEWRRKQERNEDISSEAFVEHIHKRYGRPLPVWAATELMTFGELSSLYGGMLQRDREAIAVGYDLMDVNGVGDISAFGSWLERLRQARNLCSHHGRLWNKNHTALVSVPDSCRELFHLVEGPGGKGVPAQVTRQNSRVYATLALVAYLLARIEGANEARDRLIHAIEVFAADRSDRLDSMGFPVNWRSLPIWRYGYQRDPVIVERARLLRSVDLLMTADAATSLAAGGSRSDAKSKLGYYRKKGALLSVPGAQSHRYPSFQFLAGKGEIPELVILANRRLLDGGNFSEPDQWEALRWWMSPNGWLPDGLAPADALQQGCLDVEQLNQMLTPRDDE
ncbi:hypothetical protein CJ204_08185 [Corynebacterium xerosis]|uniref:Abi family protein n=1 Tax=Corynebacterium xerosis TaxID=1725 RepID=A0A2N6SXZ6_9CORY|nr:Abi family protein [Corynebacterium xerosis]PMC61916.1 hypothetical protein CJ204_08185 [Corynebacterium xerosis]